MFGRRTLVRLPGFDEVRRPMLLVINVGLVAVEDALVRPG